VLRHVVAFELRAAEPAQRAVDAQRIRQELESLRDQIDDIHDIHVGIDHGEVAGNWEVVLVSDFADNAALERYQSHPEHVRAAEGISDLVANKAVVDYVLPV
jgi:Stress responsive A/B Barrel Domain